MMREEDRKIAFQFTFDHEGGTNFLVHDRGGLTKFGICQRQYPKVDIAALTLEQAEAIYIRDYWDRCCCGELPLPLAIVVYDSAVNCGQQAAAVWLQKAINKVAGESLEVDGVIGPITLAKVEIQNPYDIASKIVSCRLQRYISLIKRDSTQRTFVLGWMQRASDLLDYI